MEESKRSPAWSALSVLSCERARMRLHRGGWNTTTANCSNAGEQGTPFLPLSFSQSFNSAHCVSIVFFFSLRTAFLLPAYELPCVTSSVRADVISVSCLTSDQPLANFRFRAWSSANAIACRRAYRDCRHSADFFFPCTRPINPIEVIG